MKHPLTLALAAALAVSAPALAQEGTTQAPATQETAQPEDAVNTDATDSASQTQASIFASDSPLPLNYPQFDKIPGAVFQRIQQLQRRSPRRKSRE